jgi:predicted outer membrane protein
MRIHHLVVGLLAIGFLVALSAPTWGTTKIGERLAKEFKLDPKTSCVLCHDASKGEPGSRNLNKFGKDFDGAYSKQKKGSDRAVLALQSIADADADGDGATNQEEVALGSGPGDAKSVPAADKLAEYRKTHPKK